MYELNRILMRNFGPRDARYEDIDLDISGAGAPVEAATLVPAPGYVAERPSPSSLIMLENGGGKGVLLAGIMCTTIPFRHKDLEALRNFVVSQAQPSHIAMEWVDVRSGRLLVTAQALAPAREGKLDRFFYSFSPSTLLSADTLPFHRDGHWLSYEDFCDELRDLSKQHAVLELHLEEGQEKWEEHQRVLGLQPDLFDVQRAMNATESGAADAFTTSSAGAFVEWLLRKAVDDEMYAEVGKAFTAYAGALDESEQWSLEREFSLAMGAACQQVADAQVQRKGHRSEAAEAEKQLAHLASALHLRTRQLQLSVEASADAVTAAFKANTAATQAREAALNTLRHVQWTSLQLELQSTTTTQSKLSSQQSDTETELAGWRNVPLALEHVAAREGHARAQEALGQAAHAAAPYLNAADRAAARLRAAYSAAEQAAHTKIADLDEKTAQARADIRQWRARSTTLSQQAGADEAETKNLSQQVQAFDTALGQARDEGAVQPQESAADAAARAFAHARELGLSASEAKQAANGAQQSLREANRHLIDLEKTAVERHGAAQAASDEVGRLRDEAESIRSGPLCAELLEMATEEALTGDALLWLSAHAASLKELAQHRTSAVDRAMTGKKLALRADEDLLAALDTADGLLPASSEVRDVCALLAEQGIAAHPGWQWLRDNVPADDHHQVIASHPDLVGGIIVGDQTALEEAQQRLQQIRPLPAAAVALGTGERILMQVPEGGSGRSVVEPTPAMHDEDAAAEERASVEERLAARTRELLDLEARHNEARGLADSISHWHTAVGDVPVPDRLENLRRLEGAAAEANSTAQTQGAHIVTLDATAQEAVNAHESLLEQRDTAERAAEVLQRLAGAETECQRARDRIAEIEEQRSVRGRELKELTRRCDEADQDNMVRARSIESAEQEAAGYAREREKITATTEAEIAQAADSDPLDPLPLLQQRHRQALNDLHAMEVGADLRERAQQAETLLRERQTVWERVPKEVRNRAEKLMQDSRASDDVQRDAIVRGLAVELESLRGRQTDLHYQLSQLKARSESEQPPSDAGWLREPEASSWTPTNADHAQYLLESARAEHTTAQGAQRTAEKALGDAQRSQGQAKRDIDAFNLVIARLENLTQDLTLPTVNAPYPGSAEAATDDVRQAGARLSRSRGESTDSDRKLDKSVNTLKEKAVEATYQDLDIPLRKQISAVDSGVIPAMAHIWAPAFVSRAAALSSDLETVAAKRDAIVAQLAGHVTASLHMLDRASRFSTFPDGTSTWAGQKFLNIRYQMPDQAMLTGLMREAVEDLASRPRADKLKGVQVVMSCLHRAVPRGFRAEVLKPTASQRAERVPVEKMAKVFSGGQELTGAILLYCALAALRTSPGPRSRTRHGGLLLLDNPIGRANAEYLVEIQQEMAAALGIQLIYTTGLSDDNVTPLFPMRIQLRNDAEARSGLSLLRIHERVHGALIPAPRTAPDDQAPEPTGYLSTARLYRKEDPTA
ncbi:hypothetical protein ACFTZI_05690 [Streptomyces decoyicus]|uniref:hypothetical protein n=1 Tax=Streptomyces decoyicus TaxID=249567 RepID=UPI00363777FF